VEGRQLAYVSIRVVAAVAFVLGATVLPPGVPAALVVLVAGVAGLATCFGVNAGGPGERAGARPQDRYFDSLQAPQGDWPPYDEGPLPGATRPAPPPS